MILLMFVCPRECIPACTWAGGVGVDRGVCGQGGYSHTPPPVMATEVGGTHFCFIWMVDFALDFVQYEQTFSALEVSHHRRRHLPWMTLQTMCGRHMSSTHSFLPDISPNLSADDVADDIADDVYNVVCGEGRQFMQENSGPLFFPFKEQTPLLIR